MVPISRETVERADNARLFYIEYLRTIRVALKAGGRVSPDVLLNRAAVFSDPPAIMIDVSQFGPEWVCKMRRMLCSQECRAECLQSYRALLRDFERSALAALAAHFADLSDGRAFYRVAAHAVRLCQLKAAIARLKFAGVLYWLHVPTAAAIASAALDSLEPFQAILRPSVVVVPIR